MEIAIIVALIGAVIAVVGWFANSFLRRREEDRKRKIEEKSKAKELSLEVLSICSRRAVYTRMHAQTDHSAMFSSLASCRSDLQQILPKIEPEENQELIADVISKLDLIERKKEDIEVINQAKLDIIKSLVKFSERAKVSYVLPRPTTKEEFFSIEDVNKPPIGPESPTGSM